MMAIIRVLVQVLGSLAAFAFWAFMIAAACLIRTTADAAEAPTVTAFVEYGHRSDLFTGAPFFRNAPGREPTEDMLSGGLEFAWRNGWRVDVSHGAYVRDCNISAGCRGLSGTRIAVRKGWQLTGR